MSSTLPQRRAVTGALVLALCLLMLSGAASRAQAACGLGSFVPSQVIVKLDQGATITQINATYGSTVVEPFPGSTDIFLLGLPASSGVKKTVEQMVSDLRLITYAEPNFLAAAPEAGARHRAYGQGDARPSPKQLRGQGPSPLGRAGDRPRKRHHRGRLGHRRAARPPGAEGKLRGGRAARLRGRRRRPFGAPVRQQ